MSLVESCFNKRSSIRQREWFDCDHVLVQKHYLSRFSQMLITWSGGRNLLWDATVVDTVATSYIYETAAAARGAAEIATARKH